MYIVASCRGISPTANVAKRIKELCSLAISQRSLHRYDARCCIMQRYFAYGECCEADSAIAEPFDTLLHIS